MWQHHNVGCVSIRTACLEGGSIERRLLNVVFLCLQFRTGGVHAQHEEDVCKAGLCGLKPPAVLLPSEPCRWSPVLIPRVSPHRLTSLGLMMIDYGGFFITLNLISAWSNLSNDCSLLAIVKFKSFFILLHGQPVRNYGDGSWCPYIFTERVGINDTQRARWWTGSHGGFAEVTFFLGRKQWQFPLDQMWSSKRQFLLDLKAIRPFTEIPKFNKSLYFI